MKRILVAFLGILVFGMSAQAMELTGGVTYTVDSAREYVFQDMPQPKLDSNFFFARTDNVDRVVYSYDNNNRVIGISVLYKNDHTQVYIYDEHKQLIYIDKYDRDVNLYPHRGYRYDLDGNLSLTSLSVSKNEHYRFSPSGKLIAYSLNGVIYDENKRVIGRAK